MTRNAMQHGKAIGNDSSANAKAQLLIELKRRILNVREALISIGAEGDYMAFCLAQASREGKKLDKPERKAIGQIMNLRVFSNDVERVQFIERSIQSQQAA